MEKNKAYLALENIGWGPYNLKILFQCGLVKTTQAWMTYDMWFINMGYILKGCREEWGLSTFEIGIIGSFSPLGLLIGGLLWGYLSDRYGRMIAFKSSVLFCLFSSICLTFAPIYEIVALSLFTLGIGMSGELALGGNVFLEFCPPSKRYLLTLMNLFFSVGSTSIALIGFGVSYINTTSINDWRFIIGFSATVEIFATFFRFFLIETPVYCVSKGDFEKAERTLNIISLKNTGKEFLFTDAGMSKSGLYEMEDSSINCANTENLLEKPRNGMLKKLCKGKIIKTTIFLSSVFPIQAYFFASFAYTGFVDFMPEFLSEYSNSEIYGIIVIQMACGFPGIGIGTYFVETRLGRKYTTFFTYFIGGICCLPLLISKTPLTVNFIQMILLTSTMYLFIYSAYSGMFTIGPESFPTEIRGVSLAIAGMCARIAGITTPIVTGLVLEYENGFEITIIMYSISYIIAGISILMLKETKLKVKQKPLV